MKKIITLLSIIILTGCGALDISNTPTKKVEAYLDSYQKLDDNIMNDLDSLVDDTEYTVEQKARYKEIFKKHYSNLKYEIKDEKINGDKATVEVSIEVSDYSKILSEDVNKDEFKDENGVYSPSKYFDYQLDRIEKATEKVKYNIIFKLTKRNNEWIIDDLDEESKKKIHGIYLY